MLKKNERDMPGPAARKMNERVSVRASARARVCVNVHPEGLDASGRAGGRADWRRAGGSGCGAGDSVNGLGEPLLGVKN